MYGHTHVPALTIDADLVTLNPGSLTYPRAAGTTSYLHGDEIRKRKTA